jgi:hypothetical protein
MRRPMLIAGLIAGLIGFVAAMIAGSLNSQQCAPCVAVFLGAGAGYFACQLTRPETQALATRGGATAGIVSGLCTLVGHVVGGALGAWRLGPGGAADLARSLGLTVPAGLASSTTYFQTALAIGGCCGVVEVFLMGATGALAGVIWYQQTYGAARPPGGELVNG